MFSDKVKTTSKLYLIAAIFVAIGMYFLIKKTHL